jgi:hypothetical protein
MTKVFNVKVAGITASSAFILSFLIGIISGGALFIVLLRAGIWGIVFFTLVAGGYVLINRFIPELLHLEQEEEVEDAPGSHVDISVEDPSPDLENSSVAGTGETKPTGGASPDTVSDLDQNNKNEYTKEGEVEERNASSGFVPTSPETTSPKVVSQGAEQPSAVKGKEPLVSPPKQDMSGKASQEIRTIETPQDTSKVQNKMKQRDPKKMDPLQMASTIQVMLRQE